MLCCADLMRKLEWEGQLGWAAVLRCAWPQSSGDASCVNRIPLRVKTFSMLLMRAFLKEVLKNCSTRQKWAQFVLQSFGAQKQRDKLMGGGQLFPKYPLRAQCLASYSVSFWDPNMLADFTLCTQITKTEPVFKISPIVYVVSSLPWLFANNWWRELKKTLSCLVLVAVYNHLELAAVRSRILG